MSSFGGSLNFGKKSPRQRLSSVWAVCPLTYYSYFGEDLVIVSGQYLGSFRSISGSFWVIFGQKKPTGLSNRSL